ncbi:hypothetical protein NQ314_007053 [Rhamnusium bicolor]|uniref:Cyclic nucleotide-binding domain-containing protein n=1 Tax=Rhamnusium bicolor TaxID=1586634 RepID=A0AAV8YT04_9CUCU|nr:hypothetical protein NQ314_007053 [Rhamnusium bicolor]
MGSVLNYLNTICHSLKLSRELRFTILTIIKTYLLIHLVACLLFIVPIVYYVDDLPKDSWLIQAGVDSGNERHHKYIYAECVLMCACYFFGVSHGKYDISASVDEICFSMVTLFGRLYTLFLLAEVLRIFGIASVSESRYEQRLSQLEDYMNSKNLPLDLRNRLLKYYEYKLQKRYFNESEILSTLSDHLKTDLLVFAARKLIQNSSVFKLLPKSMHGTIIASMTSQTYSPGDVILLIGTIAEATYFISSGTVAVINRDGLELCHLEDGDEFAISALLSTTHVQLFSYVAVETTEVFYISKLLFFEFIQGYSEVVNLLEATVKRRMVKYGQIEKNVKKGRSDFLSELHRGLILESLVKRPIIAE